MTEHNERKDDMPLPSNLFGRMGNKEFDSEAYFNSATMKAMDAMPSKKLTNSRADNDAINAYWKENDLRREFHGAPDDRTSHWISYVPEAAFDKSNFKTYPLLFVLHGANNPVTLAETYGYTELAAEHELILVIPENERADNILELLNHAEKTWPVDRSRVYCVGYSFGSMCTARIVLQYPNIFAAAGMGGMVHASSSGESEMTGVTYPAFELTDEMVLNVKKHLMPTCLFSGENEVLNFLPLHKDANDSIMDPGKLVEPFPLAKLAAYNIWRQAGGCDAIALEKLKYGSIVSADIVENKIGALFEQTEVRNYDQRSHYIGHCVTPEGRSNMRFICCAKAPHWPTNRMAELVWEHISQFGRNRETGEIIYHQI